MINDKINFTKFIYQELAWGPLYKINDGNFVKNQDNNAQKYILNSLKNSRLKKKI